MGKVVNISKPRKPVSTLLVKQSLKCHMASSPGDRRLLNILIARELCAMIAISLLTSAAKKQLQQQG